MAQSKGLLRTIKAIGIRCGPEAQQIGNALNVERGSPGSPLHPATVRLDEDRQRERILSGNLAKMLSLKWEMVSRLCHLGVESQRYS